MARGLPGAVTGIVAGDVESTHARVSQELVEIVSVDHSPMWIFFKRLSVSTRPSGDRPPRGRGGGRGGRGGRGRGMGRGEGFDSRGKRDFDRHSGSDKS